MDPGVPTRLVQVTHPDEGRRVALVYENELHLLATYRSVYSFALAAIETGWKMRDMLSTDLSGIVLDYSEIYALGTSWRFLPAFDHPTEPGRCLVSAARAAWTYKGSGATLCGHGEPVTLALSPQATAGDLAAVYVIGPEGAPRRVGVAPGISLRSNAIGPELTLDAGLPSVAGTAKAIRNGREVWSQNMSSDGAHLLLALASIEPDLFESADCRRTGDAHVHFFGERFFGAREGFHTVDGDEIIVEFEGLGRALHNPIRAEAPVLRHAAVPL